MHRRKVVQGDLRTPTVSRLIEVDLHTIACQVDDVRRTGAINVGEANSFPVKQVGVLEPGSVVHVYLAAETPISKVGPVARLAVAYADDVTQSVAGKIRKKNCLGAVRKQNCRAFLFVVRFVEANFGT